MTGSQVMGVGLIHYPQFIKRDPISLEDQEIVKTDDINEIARMMVPKQKHEKMVKSVSEELSTSLESTSEAKVSKEV